MTSPMPRRPLVHAQLFGIDADRRKRIDDAIDYFGAGPIGVARDPCGESWLDETGARLARSTARGSRARSGGGRPRSNSDAR